MNDPLRKDAPSELAQLESRLAIMEETLKHMNEFNNSVTNALTHVLERFRAYEVLPISVSNLGQKIERDQSTAALSKLSKIYPKSRTVVFVSKGYFGDNIKYAYLAFCDYARSKDIAVRFLTDDRRQFEMLQSYGFAPLLCTDENLNEADIETLLGTKVTVLCDNFHPDFLKSSKVFGMLQGAKTVQLWHGIPVKNIGMRYLMRNDGILLEALLASAGPFDVFVGTGNAARDEWAKMFAFRQFEAAGYPRNDVFFRDLEAFDLLNTDQETLTLFADARRASRPVMLYAPTFRDDVASGWFGKANIDMIAANAQARGYLLVVNLHPYEQNLIGDYRRAYPNIRFVAPGTDIYPLVKFADALITDYSSLAFDYLLLDRPLIFYRPDHDYYRQHSRGFIEGKANLTPGAMAVNENELLRAIDIAAGFIRDPSSDSFRGARQKLLAELFDHVDGDAGGRVCELIAALVDYK